MILLGIILILIGGGACVLGFSNLYKKEKYNKEIEIANNKLQKENNYLKAEQEVEEIKLKTIQEKRDALLKVVEDSQTTAQNAFSNYCEVLETEYNKKAEEYDDLVEKLKNAYSKTFDELYAAAAEERQELDKLKHTRAAAFEAQRKEKEIEANICDYSIALKQDEIDDIQVLERVKSKLNQPRILCMLIWSTYYQKPLTALCNNLLGTSVVTGIYKITNQITKQVYIGQSADVANRWKMHAKHGLGIDTPASNQLYKAMQEDGLHNFTFELLEECPRSQLNEKEAFYIELYQAFEYRI